MIPKRKPVRSQKLRESAHGEECTVRLPGVCNWSPETSVLAHLPCGHGAMGGKSDDTHAVIACSACHDVLDGRAGGNMDEVIKLKAERDALARTHRRWIELGLLKVEGAE